MLTTEILDPVFRSSWGADTCDPSDLADWHPGNPARGQCGVTALITQELLGGDLILGEVFVGERQVGYHYWNRLPDGREVDFTADQFYPYEIITGGEEQIRRPGAPTRCRDRYDLLKLRVMADLQHEIGGHGQEEDDRAEQVP
jgi:hypothetical protein